MCTYLTDYIQKTASEDIKAYKVVMVIDGKYYAPYRRAKYLSNVITSFLGVEEMPYGKRVVQEGIHTFKYLEDAVTTAALLKSEELKSDFHVIECIIPKGALYYWGYQTFLCRTRTYVADKVVMDYSHHLDNLHEYDELWQEMNRLYQTDTKYKGIPINIAQCVLYMLASSNIKPEPRELLDMVIPFTTQYNDLVGWADGEFDRYAINKSFENKLWQVCLLKYNIRPQEICN